MHVNMDIKDTNVLSIIQMRVKRHKKIIKVKVWP